MSRGNQYITETSLKANIRLLQSSLDIALQNKYRNSGCCPRITAGQLLRGTGIVHAQDCKVSYINGTSSQFVKADGSLDSNQYITNMSGGFVPYTGATGPVDLGAFDLTVEGMTIGLGGGHDSSNTVVGAGALSNNTTGYLNTAIGNQTLANNIDGFFNTAIGGGVLLLNTSGWYNTSVGAYSSLMCEGSCNTAVGTGALYTNISGNNNVAIGFLSQTPIFGPITDNGNNNTSIGTESLSYNQVDNNIAIGAFSMCFNTSGTNNIAIGTSAAYLNQIGNDVISIGNYNLYNNLANNNISIGSHTCINSYDAYGNVVIGNYAGQNLTTGFNNTIVGNSADGIDIGNNNILIGYQAITASGGSVNEITLGNSSISALRCQVQSIITLSDRRDKTDIVPITTGIDFINKLNPVTFTWNMRDGGKIGVKSAGFIAQELLELQNNTPIGENLNLIYQANPEKLEAAYSNLLPVMVKALQDLSDENKRLSERIAVLESR